MDGRKSIECIACGGQAFPISRRPTDCGSHMTSEDVRKLLHAIGLQVFRGNRVLCAECGECFFTPTRIFSSTDGLCGRHTGETTIRHHRVVAFEKSPPSTRSMVTDGSSANE